MLVGGKSLFSSLLCNGFGVPTRFEVIDLHAYAFLGCRLKRVYEFLE